jgi:hypothetical protein
VKGTAQDAAVIVNGVLSRRADVHWVGLKRNAFVRLQHALLQESTLQPSIEAPYAGENHHRAISHQER